MVPKLVQPQTLCTPSLCGTEDDAGKGKGNTKCSPKIPILGRAGQRCVEARVQAYFLSNLLVAGHAHPEEQGEAVCSTDLGCSSGYSIGRRTFMTVVEGWSGAGFRNNSC